MSSPSFDTLTPAQRRQVEEDAVLAAVRSLGPATASSVYYRIYPIYPVGSGGPFPGIPDAPMWLDRQLIRLAFARLRAKGLIRFSREGLVEDYGHGPTHSTGCWRAVESPEVSP